MPIAWLTLILAGLLEVGWAIGLKSSDGLSFRTKPLLCTVTLATMVLSMYLLSVAVRTIPIGSGYAIWTGIGAVGAAILGMVFFHEPATLTRIGFLAMVVIGIVGLKFASPSAASAGSPTPETAMPDSSIVFYVGTYTNGTSKGIYRASLDAKTGQIALGDLAAATTNPSFLAIHPTLDVIYAVNEVGDFQGQTSTGAVSAFLISNEGKLTPLGAQPTGGDGPCYVSVSADGRTAFAANYGGGSVASFPLAENGALSPRSGFDQHVGSSINKTRQQEPHAHSIVPDRAGKFALAADLGTDLVSTYAIDPTTRSLTLTGETSAKPGSGPRHIAFNLKGDIAYVVDELANTVTTFSYRPSDGTLLPQQTLSTLPEGFAGESSVAEVAVHPSGKFLYVSNRGHDSIAIFAIDSADGTLTIRGHAFTRGKSPRHFAIDPSGQFLVVANQKSDELFSFRIDPTTGDLQPAGTAVKVGAPACVRFVR